MGRQNSNLDNKRLSLQIPVSSEEERKIKDFIETNNLKAGKFVKTLILNEISAREAE